MTKLTEAEHEATNAVLDFYSHPASVPTGSFMATVVLAYSKADPGNKSRLRKGFPEIADAMDLVNNVPGGLDVLAEKLK